MNELELLAGFTLKFFRHAREVNVTRNSHSDGRLWEQSIADLLRHPRLPNRQRAGTSTFFNVAASSGIDHELDACVAGGDTRVAVECKSRKSGVSKADVALFHEKILDFFCADPERFRQERWWRISASSTPVTRNVRAFCFSLGMILVDPDVLPLPTLLWTAGRPVADKYLNESYLQEAVRLGERANLAVQDRWTYNHYSDLVCFKPTVLSSNEIVDLMWIQEKLGSDIIEMYQQHYPDWEN